MFPPFFTHDDVLEHHLELPWSRKVTQRCFQNLYCGSQHLLCHAGWIWYSQKDVAWMDNNGQSSGWGRPLFHLQCRRNATLHLEHTRPSSVTVIHSIQKHAGSNQTNTHTHTCFIYQLCLRHHAQLICSNHGSTLTGHSSQQIHVRRTKRPGSRSVARGWVHQHYQNETKHTQFFLRWLFCVTSTCIRRWGLLAVYSSILHCWYPLKHGRWR